MVKVLRFLYEVAQTLVLLLILLLALAIFHRVETPPPACPSPPVTYGP